MHINITYYAFIVLYIYTIKHMRKIISESRGCSRYTWSHDEKDIYIAIKKSLGEPTEEVVRVLENGEVSLEAKEWTTIEANVDDALDLSIFIGPILKDKLEFLRTTLEKEKVTEGVALLSNLIRQEKNTSVYIKTTPPRESNAKVAVTALAPEVARALALRQTTTGRALLYSPDEACRKQLAKVATRLHDFYTTKCTNLEEKLAFLNRECGPDGLIYDKNSLVTQYKQKLGRGETIDDEFKKQVGRYLDDVVNEIVLPVIAKVEGPSAVTSRMCTLGLCGGIALMVDPGAQISGPAARGGEAWDPTKMVWETMRTKLQAFITEKAAGSSVQDLKESYKEAIKDRGQSLKHAPEKKQERSIIADQLQDADGILGTGPEAEKLLRARDPEFFGDAQFPRSQWCLMYMPEHRVRGLEPMAGHMSGSMAEILWGWDALVADSPADLHFAYVRMGNRQNELLEFMDEGEFDREDWKEREARAACATAFFVGEGFHSAMEVLPVAAQYLGQPITQLAHGESRELRAAGVSHSPMDVGYILYNAGATDLICELIEGCIDFKAAGLKQAVETTKTAAKAALAEGASRKSKRSRNCFRSKDPRKQNTSRSGRLQNPARKTPLYKTSRIINSSQVTWEEIRGI
jgi:hypothetical protein